jgi:hypothetical protein
MLKDRTKKSECFISDAESRSYFLPFSKYRSIGLGLGLLNKDECQKNEGGVEVVL